MQFSVVLLALAASRVMAGEAFASASAESSGDGSSHASAFAEASSGDDAPSQPEYPTYPAASNNSYPDTYPGCTTTSYHPATLTITDLTVSTYCPVCDEARGNGDVYVTTYETVYKSLCPTGLVDKTYTVSATCTGTTPIDYATPAPGFECVTTTCDYCDSATITLTQPVAAYATGVSPTGGYSSTPQAYTGSASTVSNMALVSAIFGIVSVSFGMILL